MNKQALKFGGGETTNMVQFVLYFHVKEKLKKEVKNWY